MKYDAESIAKINKLAATLRNTGLASNMADAVEKAKEIVLGKQHESPQQMEHEIQEVEDELEQDLKARGIYFPSRDERALEEPVEEEPQEAPVEFAEEEDAPMVVESDETAPELQMNGSHEEVMRLLDKAEQDVKDLDDFGIEEDLPAEEAKTEPVKDTVRETPPKAERASETPPPPKSETLPETKRPEKAPETKPQPALDKSHPAYDVSREDKTVHELMAEDKTDYTSASPEFFVDHEKKEEQKKKEE
jgi:hypothetical protein